MAGHDGAPEERPGDVTGGDRAAEPFQVTLDVAEHARVGDALAEGDAHFAVDREAVENLTSQLPGGIETGRRIVQAGVVFRHRALRYLVGVGVRQFLSLGTGLSKPDRDHHVAQGLAPASRFVYWTADPIVLAHVHQLESTPEGVVSYIQGDLHDPEAILRQAAQTLDLDQPVAILIRVLASVPDPDAGRLVDRFVAGMARGSYLVILHLALDVSVEQLAPASERLGKLVRADRLRPLRGRTHDQVSQLFDGLELVPPGVVTVDRWHPGGVSAREDDGAPPSLPDSMVPPLYGGVGRKR